MTTKTRLLVSGLFSTIFWSSVANAGIIQITEISDITYCGPGVGVNPCIWVMEASDTFLKASGYPADPGLAVYNDVKAYCKNTYPNGRLIVENGTNNWTPGTTIRSVDKTNPNQVKINLGFSCTNDPDVP